MTPRLFIPDDLTAAATLTLSPDHSHYLAQVMRRQPGDPVLLFNGRDGEWRGTLAAAGKKALTVHLQAQTRPQPAGPDGPWLLFAPVKRGPVELIARMATELGATRLIPVITEHSEPQRINHDRLNRIAIEAAEQCERLDVPDIAAPIALDSVLAGWDATRALVVCAESGPSQPLATVAASLDRGPRAVMIGPAGGFAPRELDRLRELPFVLPAGLGPRILKADTAAIAALAIVQGLTGDFAYDPPPFPRE